MAAAFKYSGDLNNGLVRISSGQNKSGVLMFSFQMYILFGLNLNGV